ITTDTSATFTWTVGSTSATETVTDTSVTGSTATLSALVIYDLTNSSVYGKYVQVEACPTLGTSFAQTCQFVQMPSTLQIRNEGQLRFRGQIGLIALYPYQNGSPLRLVIDGVDAGSVTMANSASWGWVVPFTGLDSTAAHEYAVVWGLQMNVQTLGTD